MYRSIPLGISERIDPFPTILYEQYDKVRSLSHLARTALFDKYCVLFVQN